MNPDTIPSVKEFMTDHYQIKHYKKILLKPSEAAIEFAKLHVQAALEAAADNAMKLSHTKETIKNSYSLTDIK